MSSRIGGAARCVRWSLRPLDWRRASYWRRRQARRAFSRDRKTRRPRHRSRHLRRKGGLPCRKLRSDTDSRRRGICLPMSCAGMNWASRPQQPRGSFNRRAFAATANLAVNRGLIADLVQRPSRLPHRHIGRNNAPSDIRASVCVPCDRPRPAPTALVCGDPPPDGGVAGATDRRSVPVGYGADLRDPRQ